MVIDTVTERRKIVVMGGSFNPPTIAHLKLMQTAVDEIKAEKGIFVPVSHAYLKRKMRKQDEYNICLSERLRTDMLQVMCGQDSRLSVSEMDLGSARITLYQTLQKAENIFPDAKIYFLAGIDKLDFIRQWAEHSDFLNRYGVVLFSRHGTNAEKTVMQDSVLNHFYDSFAFADAPEGISDISSTAVRRRILQGESSEVFLHPKVWELVKGLSEEDFPPEIERFRDEYEFLSNDYPAPFTWNGHTFLCAEAAVRAAKCADETQWHQFTGCSAKKAKRLSNNCISRPDWENVKLSLMKEILRAKFSQNSELATRLKDTGKAVLINGNNKKDIFWGVDLYNYRGENHLGKLLMKIRNEL